MGNTCNSNSEIDYNDHGLKYKKQIWQAFKNRECILIAMKDGTRFVGRPVFCYDEDYSKLPKGQDMVYLHLKLINDIPLHYHIGGTEKFIVLWDVSDIIVMDKDEITEYKNYNNYAPLFVKRLFPDL